MARKKSESNGTAGNNHAQFPAELILRLLVGIKSAIGMAEARTVSFDDLEKLSGRRPGTIGSWYGGTRMNQVEFVFALLERIPRRLRYELLDTIFRTQPTLQHPRLAHDPIAVSHLEALLKQPAGCTLIHGTPEHARAFLLNALGNSSREVNAGQQPVVGAELHRVPAWSLVPGVTPLSPQSEIRQQVQRVWSTIKETPDGSLVLLGALWNRVPHLHSEILHLATRCHVIIADEFAKPEDLARRVPGRVHVLTVAPAREQAEWIRVVVQGN